MFSQTSTSPFIKTLLLTTAAQLATPNQDDMGSNPFQCWLFSLSFHSLYYFHIKKISTTKSEMDRAQASISNLATFDNTSERQTRLLSVLIAI